MNTHLRVYVPLETDKHNSLLSDNTQRAINLFQGQAPDNLTVTVISFVPSESKDHDQDSETFRQALSASYTEDEKAYVIVCKDTSISCASSQSILEVINQVIQRDLTSADNSFDLYYLAKWFDECHLYTNKSELDGRGIFVTDTVNPRGTQCIMFSPRGVNKFLKLKRNLKGHQLSNVLRNRITSRSTVNHNEADVRFVAVTTFPSQIQFDIRYNKTDSDYAKTQECAPVSGPHKPEKGSSNIGFFIFIVIAAVIAIAIYCLVQYGLTHINELSPTGNSLYALPPQN